MGGPVATGINLNLLHFKLYKMGLQTGYIPKRIQGPIEIVQDLTSGEKLGTEQEASLTFSPSEVTLCWGSLGVLSAKIIAP